MTYGRTADSATFMARSANHSTKGSRRGFVDVDTGVDPAAELTWEQRRGNLVNRKKALERARGQVVGAEFVRLGLEIQKVDTALRELKAQRPSRMHEYEHAFIHAANKLLPQALLDRIHNEAKRLSLEAASEALS